MSDGINRLVRKRADGPWSRVHIKTTHCFWIVLDSWFLEHIEQNADGKILMVRCCAVMAQQFPTCWTSMTLWDAGICLAEQTEKNYRKTDIFSGLKRHRPSDLASGWHVEGSCCKVMILSHNSYGHTDFGYEKNAGDLLRACHPSIQNPMIVDGYVRSQCWFKHGNGIWENHPKNGWKKSIAMLQCLISRGYSSTCKPPTSIDILIVLKCFKHETQLDNLWTSPFRPSCTREQALCVCV